MMPRWKNTIRRILLYSTALVLALLLLSPIILPPLLNSHAVRQRLVRQLHQATGVLLSPDKIRIALMPFPAIRLEALSLTLGPVSVNIGSLNIELDVVDLLNRQLTVNRISIDNPLIRYDHAAQRSIGFWDGFPDLPPDLVDKLFGMLTQHQGNIVLSVADLKSAYFADMDAQLTALKKEKKILVNATIQGIDMDGDRIGQITRGLDLPFKRIKGSGATLMLTLDNLGSLKGKVTLTAPEVTCDGLSKGPLAAEALTFDIALSRNSRHASLAPAQLTYPAGRVGVDFDQDKGSGKTALTFTGKQVNISHAREVCLPLLKGIEVSDTLFDILRAGTARTVSVGFKSPVLNTLFNPESLIISGQATAARVKIPEVPLIAEKVGADVTMSKGVLHIEPRRGKVAGATLKSGVLDIDLIRHHEVPFSGTFSMEADLKNLPQTLASLLPETRLAEEMAMISTISGTAKARLNLAMPPGKKQLEVVVKAREIKASGSYDRIPLALRIDAGTFSYEDGKVFLEDFSGALGDNPVRDLTASATVGDDPQLDVTAAAGQFALQDLLPWIHSHPPANDLLSPVQDLAGILTLDSLSIQGPMFSPSLWQFSVKGSGTTIDVGFEGYPKAIEQVSARFEVSETQFAVSDLAAKANDLHWLEFAFDRETIDSIRLPVEIFESRVDKTDLMFVHGKLKFPAGPTGLLDLSGRDTAHLTPTLLALKDAGLSDLLVIPYSDPNKPRYSVDGRIDTRTLQKLLIPGTALHSALNEITGGDIMALYTDSVSDLHLNSYKLNLDSFLKRKKAGKDKQEKEKANSRPLLAQKRLFFNGRELIYQNRSFTDVDAVVRFDRDATRVEISKAALCGLTGTGQVIIPHGAAAPDISTLFFVESQDSTNIARMSSCLFKSQSAINGTYTFSMDLTGRAPRDTIVRSQQGSLKFEAVQGRIFKATILSRLLSVINILDVDLKQKGFAYKRFTVEADIRDSVIELKKCYIDAENMAVIASGWLDPLNDKMDITFLVAPFKTIDTIIKAIPVVNTILSGRLVSLPARASGSISEPKVVPLAPSAVGKGLINMLKDLVKTPVRLFQDEKTP